MKVVVLGGSGVFGSRLARLLDADNHEVIVAGRRAGPLKQIASEIGAASLVIDRSGDLAALWALSPDAVVDAAGPFHAYGADPYRLARAAIENKCHYIDLADDADFCKGISSLDGEAKSADVFALSGASSVPSLSSAVIASLSEDATEIERIETAILPGNRAPRGQSVIDSILHQAGTPIEVTLEGKETTIRSWSDPKTFDLGHGLKRRGYAIRVPDQSLFPSVFEARTVTFHAGLEVGLLNGGLAAFSKVRSIIGFGVGRTFGRMVRFLANLTHGLGTDVGGMTVMVLANTQTGWRRRIWRLVVRKGDGPYVPAVAARAILRTVDQQKPGARPALVAFTLEEAEDAMSDLAATTQQLDEPAEPIFYEVMGGDMGKLPIAVQETHNNQRETFWRGESDVVRGTGLFARLSGKVFGFPSAQKRAPVSVRKTPRDGEEIWVRHFAGETFRSVLRPSQGRMTERFGPFTYDLGLKVDTAGLHFPVSAGWFLGIPLPAWALPKSVSREYEEDGVFRFDVALFAPVTRELVVHYRGWLKWVKE